MFLWSMRKYRDNLVKIGYEVYYHSIDDDNFKDIFEDKFLKVIKKEDISKIKYFEIEDHFFEKRFNNFVLVNKLNHETINNPMFLTSRLEFKEFLKSQKKLIRMASFYQKIRQKLSILIDDQNKPLGGKWSYDEDNRKKLPKNTLIPKFPEIKETIHTKKLKPIIDNLFTKHPGDTKKFWFATEYNDVLKLLDFFIKDKLNLFGDYEDAVDQKNNILFHSALSPYLNLGLITPDIIIQKIMTYHHSKSVRLNSLEGYIRQIIGWREFMRGIYQNYSKEMESGNFFKHNRKMKDTFYDGSTGLDPLDHAIKNADKFGWSHHIERLMILSNIMNLCEVEPKSVYKWFMEMFVDSSDWVMVPNVYGMGLFSDGGIFATKPYICGSSYFMKMMDFKRGNWCNVMDGLYWRFIDRNRKFFLKNPRLSMMVRIFDKMKEDRKKLILSEANKFIKDNTYGN